MSALKGLVETVAASEWASRIMAGYRRSRALVLAYHNVVPTGADRGGDSSLHLDFDAFRRQLDALARLGSVVSIEDALEGGQSGTRVAVSFDDAYLGSIELGLPELSSRGFPATVFVAPAILSQPVLWWDALGMMEGNAEPLRSEALSRLAGDEEQIRPWLSGIGRVTARPHHQVASLAQLTDACERNIHLTIGAHSWSHPNLTRVPAPRLREELQRTRAWLEAHFSGRSRPWLAYPYGLADDAVRRASTAAGYSAGFEVSGGWFVPGLRPYAIPRFNVPAGISLQGFVARVNGVLPR